MATCDTCGNDYHDAFTVTRGGLTGTFDSFECAIHTFAPRCATCSITVLGHGVQADGLIYCCRHCADSAGHRGARDNLDAARTGTLDESK